MANFQFNEKIHAYTLNGQKLPGVTTILNVIAKPALIPWAVGLAVEHLRKNPEDFDGAKAAHRVRKEKAGDIGTAVHGFIEEYAKTGIEPTVEDPQAKKMVDKFVEWAKEEGIKVLSSEVRLYSETHWYAGTADLVFEKDGKIYVGDVKTAKDIYNTNYIQMAGYHICLEEMGLYKDIHGYCVINIPKEFKKDGSAKIKVKYLYNIHATRKAFLAALELFTFIRDND
jgi:hypothetical protein